MNEKKIIEQDIESVYLGNLRTIEFDLTLPTKGKFGSTITWETKDDRFITIDGKVTRPAYGKGDRVIPLTATFTYNNESATKIYEVNVLEEENNIKVKEIFPVNIKGKVDETFYLPEVVAVKTEENEIFAHEVIWDCNKELCYKEVGTHSVKGSIKDTIYKLEATVKVVEELNEINKRDKKVNPFPIKSVELIGSSMAKDSLDKRVEFFLNVDDDQMLYNFRAASGLDTQNAPEMIGWDSPDCLLKGHTTGHYISGLALCYGVTKNEKILEKLNYMISELDKVSEAFAKMDNVKFGFISGYTEEQFDLLEEYVPYPQIWAPYYTLHKIFAGLLDTYEITNNKTALKLADELGDWVYNRLSALSHEKLTKMWSMYIAGEFGGMNESLATLYTITKKDTHLKAAMYFDNDKLFYPMEQKIDTLGSIHANQHIPQVIGALKIYEASNINKYYEISKFFWEIVTKSHVYNIGGTGSGEMFQQPDVIGTKLGEFTAESCASYNLLKLTKDLFAYEPSVDKMDYYEKTMLNHILSSSDKESKGASTYFMPTNPGSQKTFDDENSCCHGTGLESQFKYSEAIYFYNNSHLYINLFLSSHLNDEETNLDVEMLVDDNTPNIVNIKVNKSDKNLLIRKPNWAKTTNICVDGKKVDCVEKDGYLEVYISNKSEIKVEFSIDYYITETADAKDVVSLHYGPYVLATLSENKDFINIKDIDFTKIEKTNLEFKYNNLIFKPLAAINHEHYHLYMQV